MAAQRCIAKYRDEKKNPFHAPPPAVSEPSQKQNEAEPLSRPRLANLRFLSYRIAMLQNLKPCDRMKSNPPTHLMPKPEHTSGIFTLLREFECVS